MFFAEDNVISLSGIMIHSHYLPLVQFNDSKPSLIFYQNAIVNSRSKSSLISGKTRRKLRKFAGDCGGS